MIERTNFISQCRDAITSMPEIIKTQIKTEFQPMIDHLNTTFKHMEGYWKSMQFVHKQMMAEIRIKRDSSKHQSTFNTFDVWDGQEAFLWKLPKVDFPKFDKEDPHAWLYKAKQYFNLHKTPKPQKLLMVSFNQDHEASQCYQWLQSIENNLTRQSFQYPLLEIRTKRIWRFHTLTNKVEIEIYCKRLPNTVWKVDK